MEATDIAARPHAHAPTGTDSAAVRVLIVEDRPVARRLLTDELTREGTIDVVGAARDGAEAIELVRTLRPDVVLLDVVMPGMDGIEALARIRQFSTVPVIMLTSAQVAADSLEYVARARGADAFFRKPSGSVSVDLYNISNKLVAEIRRLAGEHRTPGTAP